VARSPGIGFPDIESQALLLLGDRDPGAESFIRHQAK